MKKRILVVDDEKTIVELVSFNLTKESFDVSSAFNGEDAMKLISTNRFDLIILDIMLPGIQGLELCKMLRSSEKTENIPIIMLTAKNDELDKVLGLEFGADDYITKPFSTRELVARVKAVMRRSQIKPQEDKTIAIGELEINTETYQVKKRNSEIKISATEFKLLYFMIRKKGKVLTRDILLDAVWKDEAYVEPRTVDVHVRRLRAQIEDNPSKPVYIKTRRGIGYYFDDIQ